jgi:hypothetical protein
LEFSWHTSVILFSSYNDSKLLIPVNFLLVLSSHLTTTTADYVVPATFKLDVHSHIIPTARRQALIAAGYPVKKNQLFTDDFPVPSWEIASHIADMDKLGVNYSTISISAPGVSFLANNALASASLARQLNNEMYNYTKMYPKIIGAMCLLPLPHTKESLA